MPILGLSSFSVEVQTDWRSSSAGNAYTASTSCERKPAYAIARNTHLAEIVRRLPRSLAALREIDGIGEAFCRDYGAKVLGLIPDVLGPAPAGAAGAGEEQRAGVAGEGEAGAGEHAGAKSGVDENEN